MVRMTEPLRFLSLGLGTQSCALGLMSAAGDLPKLDGIVFADTQGELPETYEYLDYFRGVVEAAGIPIYVVTSGSLEAALLDGESKKNPTPPLYVINEDGTDGRIGQYRCSFDFKRRIIERKVKQLCGGRGDWKRANVEQWLGFSFDEQDRCRTADQCRCGHKRTAKVGKVKTLIHSTVDGCTRCDCTQFDPWQTNRWPLIEMRMNRDDTIAWFAANGHPTPGRSACWFCPNSRNGRWRELKANHPDLFERACVLDETIRGGGGGFNAPGGKHHFDGEMFLHESRVALRDADIRTRTERERDLGIFTLFDEHELPADCETGVCFT